MPPPGNEDLAVSPDNLRAALWMCGATVLFAMMIVIVRYLSETHHALEIVFFRNFFGLVAMLPWLYRNGLGALRTRRFPMHLGRATLGFCAMATWFTALTLMPLAEATALSFTAPMFISILAIWVFGETMRLRRWTAIILAFVGVLIIVRPGIETLQFAAILALGSALLNAFSTVTVKVLGRTEPSPVIVTYMVLLLTPLSLIGAVFVWQWPTLLEFVAFAGLGICGSISHYFVSRALNQGEASFVAPFDYLRLPSVALFAYLAFGETVDAATWIGASIIIASGLYIAQREAALRARRPPPANGAG